MQLCALTMQCVQQHTCSVAVSKDCMHVHPCHSIYQEACDAVVVVVVVAAAADDDDDVHVASFYRSINSIPVSSSPNIYRFAAPGNRVARHSQSHRSLISPHCCRDHMVLGTANVCFTIRLLYDRNC